MRRSAPVLSPNDLLTAQDVAARFGVSRSTIWRWHKSGALPASVVFVGGPYKGRFKLVTEEAPCSPV